jgi:hypothetical protein
MLYLVLERDLKKLILARKRVLSREELSKGSTAIYLIIAVARSRVVNLKSKFEKPGFPVAQLIRS